MEEIPISAILPHSIAVSSDTWKVVTANVTDHPRGGSKVITWMGIRNQVTTPAIHA